MERLSHWAEQSYGFKFGNISPYSFLNQQEYDLLATVEDIPALLKALDKENRESAAFIEERLGFDLNELDSEKSFFHPAKTLKDILNLVEETYDKKQTEVHRIVSCISKNDFLALRDSNKCNSFGEFLRDLAFS